MAGDFGMILAHGVGYRTKWNESRRMAVLGADRTEDVGRGRALVLWRRGRRSALCPTAGDPILLTDPGLCAARLTISATAAGKLCEMARPLHAYYNAGFRLQGIEHK